MDIDYYEKYQRELFATGRVDLNKATKLVLDCDPGGDDAQAMILAFHLAKQRGL